MLGRGGPAPNEDSPARLALLLNQPHRPNFLTVWLAAAYLGKACRQNCCPVSRHVIQRGEALVLLNMLNAIECYMMIDCYTRRSACKPHTKAGDMCRYYKS
jgi:hypothetical protein